MKVKESLLRAASRYFARTNQPTHRAHGGLQDTCVLPGEKREICWLFLAYQVDEFLAGVDAELVVDVANVVVHDVTRTRPLSRRSLQAEGAASHPEARSAASLRAFARKLAERIEQSTGLFDKQTGSLQTEGAALHPEACGALGGVGARFVFAP